MQQQIKPISLPLPFRLGSVNCYLVQTDTGYVLIDTACSNKRNELETVLERAGCRPGNLKLIVLTHGDFDHAGNARYLGARFGAPVAMHQDDFGMVERGDMFCSRDKGNRLLGAVCSLLFGFGKSQRFRPQVSLTDGSHLSCYGFEATVLSLPGHSKGSIGIRTSDGVLFCGDLLENTRRPALGPIVDDAAAMAASVEHLKSLTINIVHPGHGKPFAVEELTKDT